MLVRTLHSETPEGVLENRADLDNSALSGVTNDSFENTGKDCWSDVEGAPLPQLPRFVNS